MVPHALVVMRMLDLITVSDNEVNSLKFSTNSSDALTDLNISFSPEDYQGRLKTLRSLPLRITAITDKGGQIGELCNSKGRPSILQLERLLADSMATAIWSCQHLILYNNHYERKRWQHRREKGKQMLEIEEDKVKI